MMITLADIDIEQRERLYLLELLAWARPQKRIHPVKSNGNV